MREREREREKGREGTCSPEYYRVQFEVCCNLLNKSQRGLLFGHEPFHLDLMEFEEFLTCLQKSPVVVRIEEAQLSDEFLCKSKEKERNFQCQRRRRECVFYEMLN
jgi:hypothetical protein